MNRRNTDGLLLEKGDFLVQQGGDCGVRSVDQWLRCVDEEGGAVICNTIRNNAYEDCHDGVSLDLR